jgi:hypothetical protein
VLRAYRAGWLLYYGDAESHLNHARRVFDSLTPGSEQFGTVWLPLPHLLMLPIIANNTLWYTGLAGAIPSAICFVAATTFLFAATRRLFGSFSVGTTSAAVFALNPNMLYLQAIPMNYSIFWCSSSRASRLCLSSVLAPWLLRQHSLVTKDGFCFR